MGIVVHDQDEGWHDKYILDAFLWGPLTLKQVQQYLGGQDGVLLLTIARLVREEKLVLLKGEQCVAHSIKYRLP